MGVFTKLETLLTDKLHSLSVTHIANFSSKVIILFKLGIPILILYYGYSILSGRGSNTSIPEMIFNLARIGIVFAFVENSGGLLDLAIGFIHELKTGFIGAPSLFSLLDEQFSVTQQLSQDVFKLDTDIIKLRGAIASLMIWLGAILVLASSSIIFVAAEVGLTLLIVTSPIFVGCLTYGFTRELFNGWLRSIFSCIITLIFATLVVKIGIDISNDMVKKLASNPQDNGLLTIGAIATITGVVITSLVLISTKMAGNIAGVAATAAVQGGMTWAAARGYDTASSSRSSQAQGGRNTGANSNTSSIPNRPIAVNSSVSNTQSKIDSDALKSASQKSSMARVQKANSQS